VKTLWTKQSQFVVFFGAAARILARRFAMVLAPTPLPATYLLSTLAGTPVIIPIGNTLPIVI